MKKNFLGIFFLILTGCTSETSIISSDTNTTFVLGSSEYVLFLPEGWTVIPEKNNFNTVFLAKKHSQNISIVLGGKSTDGIKEKLLEDAKLYLPGFKFLSETSDEFSFETNNGVEKRTYTQKLVSIGEEFLVASCSYKLSTAKDECSQIFNSISLE